MHEKEKNEKKTRKQSHNNLIIIFLRQLMQEKEIVSR
jgi:hypothetical protein